MVWSNTDSLEGAWFIASVNVFPLSEQQLVDCDLVDSTCNGVFVDNGFAFGEKNGLCTGQLQLHLNKRHMQGFELHRGHYSEKCHGIQGRVHRH